MFIRAAFTMLLLLLLPFGSIRAASVLPLGLNSLYQDAKYIFHGTCISNNATRDNSLGAVVTYTKFQIIKVIKGDLPERYSIKQYGGTTPGGETLFVPGAPHFEEGQEYIVFLPEPSPFGFSSPVGFNQGKFDIRKNSGDTVTVTNGRNIDDLLQNVEQAADLTHIPPERKNVIRRKSGIAESRDETAIPYDEFIALLHSMRAEH